MDATARGRSSRFQSRALAALAIVAVLAAACDTTPSKAPSSAPEGSAPVPSTTQPAETLTPALSPGPGPTDEATTSQALIAADLASGAITQAQSLLYRAWTAFGDPRLPDKYFGTGEASEDQSLIADIAAVLPTLDPAQRAELEQFTRRPTDPASYWSSASPSADARASGGSVVLAQAAATPSPDRCIAPNQWWPLDWSPDGDPDHGFRYWACNRREVDARPDLQAAAAIGSKLWAPMTADEPNGLGKPVSDKGIVDKNGRDQSDGNGKIDVYLLLPGVPCRQRGQSCRPIAGLATSGQDSPSHCGMSPYPANACTSYMRLNRAQVHDPDMGFLFAHEFFHILQDAHNGNLGDFWYVEASANWAEWEYVATTNNLSASTAPARQSLFDWATDYLLHGHSVLRHVYLGDDGYRAWLWPLFQSTVSGPQTIFRTWQALESVTGTFDVDDTIDRQFPFADHLRDFAAWNAQPVSYKLDQSTGLDDIRWQRKPDLRAPTPFPGDPRHETPIVQRVSLGQASQPVDVEAADAQYTTFLTVDPAVRQIVFDAGAVSNRQNVELQVLGKLLPRGEDPTDEWRRIIGNGPRLTLCRDKPEENVDRFELVVSNNGHRRDQAGINPDPALQARGDLRITASDECGVPGGFTGTFSGTNTIDTWQGTVTFKRVQPNTNAAQCEQVPGQARYCYEVVGGSVTWTTVKIGTTTVSLGPPDAVGEVVLFISDAAHPDHAGTYEIGVTPSTEIRNGDRLAFDTVRAWMNAIKYPHFPADFHLAGQEDSGSVCGIDGCGPTTIWHWDLTPTP